MLAGKKIHFVGATGPINFAATGRVNALAYDIWQHKPDGIGAVVKTITLKLARAGRGTRRSCRGRGLQATGDVGSSWPS